MCPLTLGDRTHLEARPEIVHAIGVPAHRQPLHERAIDGRGEPTLRSTIAIEECSMLRMREIAAARVVIAHPGHQELEACILLVFRRVLVRLPRSLPAVRQTRLDAGIHEQQQRRVSKRSTREVGVTALDDPAVVLVAERPHVAVGRLAAARNRNFARLPCHAVQVERRQRMSCSDLVCERGLARPGIPDDGDPHSPTIKHHQRLACFNSSAGTCEADPERPRESAPRVWSSPPRT
jgi:hypothetical protein